MAGGKMPIEQKKNKIIVRDNDGALVQLLPETDASQVNYGSTNVQSAIDEMAGNEVEQVYTEVTSKNRTETETVHHTYDGWIGCSTGQFGFLLQFGYSTGGSSASYETHNVGTFYADQMHYYDHDADDELVSVESNRRALASNVKYYYNFTLPEEIDYNAVRIETVDNAFITNKDGELSSPGKYRVVGKYHVSNSAYSTWSSNNAFVELTLPNPDESVKYYFNGFQTGSTVAAVPNPSMYVEIEHVADNSYAFIFHWEYGEDVQVSNEIVWKELKTTLEMANGTLNATEKPFTGLLQTIDSNIEYNFVHSIDETTNAANVVQNQILTISKKDANGTNSADTIQIMPSSIASWKPEENAHLPGDNVNGFICGIDASNLAVGGTYYEIESMIETL